MVMNQTVAITRKWKTAIAKRAVLGLCVVTIVMAPLWLPHQLHGSWLLLDEERVRELVARLGAAGPLALIGLMVLAIVVSPIPSGPIAVAAGALYGTFWGGTLTIIGAGLGALTAFSAARYLGYDAIRKSSNPAVKFITAPRPQLPLMGIVFASRLVPFISFDAVSYAAGLTCLSFWRFAAATTLGIVPICFALAAVGAGMIGSHHNVMAFVMLAGGVTLVPFLASWIWARFRGRVCRRRFWA
jgi:uncharacterized membrane protein YdjX (TVP38/TMEM64 family)